MDLRHYPTRFVAITEIATLVSALNWWIGSGWMEICKIQWFQQGFCSRCLCIGCPLKKPKGKTCDLVQSSLQFVLFGLFVIGLFWHPRSWWVFQKRNINVTSYHNRTCPNLGQLLLWHSGGAICRMYQGFAYTWRKQRLVCFCMFTSYVLVIIHQMMRTFKNPQYHLPASFTTPPFHSQVYAVGSFFARAEDQLSLENGRVIIPPALQQGFLQPVLEWLETENAAEDENKTHKIYDQVEPRNTNGNKFKCVLPVLGPCGTPKSWCWSKGF